MTRLDVGGTSQRGPNVAVYALAGTIVGAIIGAMASLLGAYVTGEQESKLDSLSTKRLAFAAFVAEAEQYGTQLRNVRDAFADDDMTLFEEEKDRLDDEASGELYAAMSVVWMVGDPTTATAALDVRAKLGDWNLPTETDRDARLRQMEKALVEGAQLLPAFIDAARADLDDE